MDWLDRLSIWAIVLLLIGSSVVVSLHMGEARPEQARHQHTAEVSEVSRTDLQKRAAAVRMLIESGNLEKADAAVAEMLAAFPYDGEPHMLKGDILFRRQDLTGAVLEYREAVDLNPDYLDRKTTSFQGKKLKNAVSEALSEVEWKLTSGGGDEALLAQRKMLYYLQRRIAGSCG